MKMATPTPTPVVAKLQVGGRRLAVALTLAALADVVSIFVTLAPPLQWSVDLAVALALFVVLGWQWILLPGLMLEAIPALSVFPFWVLVVGAVALWGAPCPTRKTIDSPRDDNRRRTL